MLCIDLEVWKHWVVLVVFGLHAADVGQLAQEIELIFDSGNWPIVIPAQSSPSSASDFSSMIRTGIGLSSA
jgi:hypothetical protein